MFRVCVRSVRGANGSRNMSVREKAPSVYGGQTHHRNLKPHLHHNTFGLKQNSDDLRGTSGNMEAATRLVRKAGK